jgi:hypothetical protein
MRGLRFMKKRALFCHSRILCQVAQNYSPSPGIFERSIRFTHIFIMDNTQSVAIDFNNTAADIVTALSSVAIEVMTSSSQVGRIMLKVKVYLP